MSANTPMSPVTPRPAATCVLMRPHAGGAEGIEVFMVRRHIQSDFAPDVYVFPGGSVDAGDRLTEETPGLCAPVDEAAGAATLGDGFRVAALRECFEEAGVLLARHGAVPLAIGESDIAHFADYRAALHSHQLTMAALARAGEADPRHRQPHRLGALDYP